MSRRIRVLVVDDDPDVRDMLGDYLQAHDYDVVGVDCGAAMRKALDERVPDIVLLDVSLPGEDGLLLARYLRERLDVAIIIVSAAGDKVDRIVGLEVGADDYIAKPFDPRELLARLKSVLRRYIKHVGGQPPAATSTEDEVSEGSVAFGRGKLNLQSRQLFDKQGREIPLTPAEYEFARVFFERPNRVLSRDQLLNLTQNRDWDPYDRSVDIRIARLRRKIEANPGQPETIRTVWGKGYMYVPAED